MRWVLGGSDQRPERPNERIQCRVWTRGRRGDQRQNASLAANSLHGSVFELLQNKDLNANSWTKYQAGKPRGPFVQNQFGATAGGPLVKNKLFMFGDYQGTASPLQAVSRDSDSPAATATVPTAADEAGRFFEHPGRRRHGHGCQRGSDQFRQGHDLRSAVYHGARSAPVSRTPFPGNMIPANRLILPLPNSSNSFPRRISESLPAPSRRATTSTTRPARKLPIRATPASITGSATKTACSAR